MNGRIHRRVTALKTLHAQKFFRGERTQRKFGTSAMGSPDTFVAICTNGRSLSCCRSLRDELTGKMRTQRTSGFSVPKSGFVPKRRFARERMNNVGTY